MADAIPAATLVLFREGADGAEHLFVERAATMAFAAGALVFPGGRVDAGDRAIAQGHADLDPDDAAARVAAIRETIEEAGIAIGLTPAPDAAAVARIRDGLRDGAVFADLLAAGRFALDPDALMPFARWCPNFPEARIFDTRFYLAAASDAEATVDTTENVSLRWATAAAVLAEADAGRARIIFPTRRNLERLAALGSLEAARTQAAAIPVELVTPWIEERDGARHLCIPEGRGYPVTSEPMVTVTRGTP